MITTNVDIPLSQKKVFVKNYGFLSFAKKFGNKFEKYNQLINSKN